MDIIDNIKGIPKRGEKFFDKLRDLNTIGGVLDIEELRTCIFNEYITYFGEETGIKEFSKNYISLKVLDKYEGFTIPEPQPFEKETNINKLFE